MEPDLPPGATPRVIVIGGGFGGLAAARALDGADAVIKLFDRRNHHTFQPLLYQVATAALSPADIAAPIRGILSGQANCRVALAEVAGVDLGRRRVLFDGGWAGYDYLVVAAGATHSYFGHPEWEATAPGLKTIEDATEIRRRILLAFENAEYEGSESARRAALTFAVVGGGPTGVELAGAIKEIAAQTIPRDFRNIDTRTTRVMLVQGAGRLLPSFHPELGDRARRDLEAMGVEVRLDARVTDVRPDGVMVGDEFIPVRTVFWAAGVRANPITETMGVELDREGRVAVGPDLSVPGHPEVFVVGDIASAGAGDARDPSKRVPGVAQGAIQGGAHAGRIIAREIASGGRAGERPAFVYRDKGSMATIGRARAVAEVGRRRFTGFVAFVLWSVVHVVFLVGFRRRLLVLLNWAWNWIVFSRGARLITGDADLDLVRVREDAGVVASEPEPAPE